ncbi:uncharacterized protein P884DRAFT_212618 [Thermothelomyces heterothallicus CBS 202.75]|uniref:uncharacterized protein n=1 Tax=Thermothelomyces heterothallicus CBS 202.75 TaxID=1149848 RepID=UPI003742249C
MGAPHAKFALEPDPDLDGLGNHAPMFKKHKVLPHPRKDELQRSAPLRYGRKSEASLPRNSALPAASPSGRHHRASRQARGPEPPPTPPAHSRTSSASHPANPSTPQYADTPLGSTDSVEPRPLATPNQQTPPTPNLTPDQTPPGPPAGQASRRPLLNVRNSSRVTADSRDDSFTTAREDPYSSDNDDGGSTLRPSSPSARTSQSTVRQVGRETRSVSQPVGLGLGFEPRPTEDSKPRAAQEFAKFDGDWTNGQAGASEADRKREREWDSGLMKNVTVRKRRPARPRETRDPEVVDDRAVTPTNAARALRSVPLGESPIIYSSRRIASDRYPAPRAAGPHSESSSSVDVKRSSVISTKSNVSATVEAMVVETAPQRRKTLRHVKKQSTLRDSGSEISPASSAPTSVSPAANGQRQPLGAAAPVAGENVRESYASTTTNHSISSRKARLSVWNSGGVPVVVIPERRSSVRSDGKPPSLRSTSSRRTWSLGSASVPQPSGSKEHVPIFERPGRRGRAYSEPDGSRPGDQRTMDFPPVIPTRSSSLSAPTSRNASRTGSLTAESLRNHGMLQAQQAHRALQEASWKPDQRDNNPRPAAGDEQQSGREVHRPLASVETESRQPVVSAERAPRREKQSELDGSPALALQDSHSTPRENGVLGVERDEDPFFGKRLSVQNTPLSVASAETTTTSHAEVSEAMAVNIYPHQSKSVVLVNHSAKPSESSSLKQQQHKSSSLDTPIARASGERADALSTPPPLQPPVNDVDSPLRNPRAPPKPPAINFIPATPSGLTTTSEKQKQLGNYYEMTAEKPKRGMSLLKRALTGRTPSDYGPSPARPVGILTRTFSLSRNIRRRNERPGLRRRSTVDSVPPDETRLHPHWRPAYVQDEPCDCPSCREREEADYDYDDRDRDRVRVRVGEDEDEEEEHGRTYRYPLIDNRPARSSPPSFPSSRVSPRRRLSERIKRTFAILPLQNGYEDDDEDGDMFGRYDRSFPATAPDAPDRRTIRRTPSGNLRVMKVRRSMESLTGRRGTPPAAAVRPAVVGGDSQRRGRTFERGYTRLWRSLSRRARRSVRRRGSLGGGIGGGYSGPTAADSREKDKDRRETRRGGGRGSSNDGRGGGGGGGATTAGFLPSLGDRINIPRRLSERRRERRTEELRGKISGPREVRDGVGDVIRRNSWRDRDALYVMEQQRERRLMLQQQRQQQQQQQQGERRG